MTRPNEPPQPDPIAYFLTWPTYGTWLPGDERGWVWRGHGHQSADPVRKLEAEARMTEDACRLDEEQRRVVETTIVEHCRTRCWHLHTVNCRSNHVHVVVTAAVHPKRVREQLKAWCTRKLKALQQERDPLAPVREQWWAERGSDRYLNDESGLEEAVRYVVDGQDRPKQ